MARRPIRAAVATGVALAAVTTAGLSAWAAGWFGASPDSAVTGEVLVSADGRTLTASVSWTGCEYRPTLTADESSTTVTLQVERDRHAPDGAACDDGQAQQLTVTLGQPLGGRRLQSAGRPPDLGVFPATDLRQPGYLPAGYAPTTDVGFYVENHLTRFDASGPHYVKPATPSWERGYASPRNRYAVLFIAQTVGDSAPRRGTAVSVNGHPGRLTLVWSSPGHQLGETLSWFDGAYTMTIQEQAPDLTQADVLRVAEGLH